MAVNGEKSFWYFTVARWACISLSLLGGYTCFRWARELYGIVAGLLALTLWCMCPNIMAHGQLITPDAGATSLGVVASYLFWRWLRQPTWTRTVWVGGVLGLAELAKMTWIMLFILWPALWAVRRLVEHKNVLWKTCRCQSLQMALMLVLALYVVNVGYGFEGSFRQLGQFEFVSRVLSGRDTGDAGANGMRSGNRFRGTCLASVPVPLPANYVMGIDVQRAEFESRKLSYLHGEWRLGGWWYYYLYALAIKVPVGTLILAMAALALRVCRPGPTGLWLEELVLLATVSGVLILVSSQTGFNHHLRYVLLIFPFAFIWISGVAVVMEGSWKARLLVGGATVWAAVSSLCVYPHSLSYFNELVGGPRQGHAYLLESNIDWGQDLLFLKLDIRSFC
jgi:Dolichyl-phosphate-mannose-protein mannosyltransferase